MNTFSNINAVIPSSMINHDSHYVNLSENVNLKKNFLNSSTIKIKNKNLLYSIQNKKYPIKISNIKNRNDIKIIDKIVNNDVKENNYYNIHSLIGHNVLIVSSKIIHVENQDMVYGYFLPEKTLFTLVNIEDQNHKLIFSYKINCQEAGEYLYYWNGQIDDTNTINPGVYNISIVAINSTESYIIQPLISGKVEGIENIPNTNTYKIDLGYMGKVNLEDIQKIL